MSPWILIIILLNPGSQIVGSAGTAIASVDFPDRESCELAAHQVRKMVEPFTYAAPATIPALTSCIRRAP